VTRKRSPKMTAPIALVAEFYRPVPDDRIKQAEEVIAELRSGVLTAFVLVAVGPETSGVTVGFEQGRMDRMQILGNLAIMRRKIENRELENEELESE
jgi:hypothetical protein